MKGILLAGGSGTRLYPLTLATSKQLLPVYDKPMVYYPLSLLMQAGIRDILIITTPYDMERFQRLLGNGSQFGVKLSYKAQAAPDGLAQAFVIGKDFIGNDDVCLVLGDNIFIGDEMRSCLSQCVANIATNRGATVFAYSVPDPENYGIVELDSSGYAISLEEKPKYPRSNLCVPGVYFYDNFAVGYAEKLKPSRRNEYEITDLNRIYLKQGKLKVIVLDKSISWFDTGTPDNLIAASSYVQQVEFANGYKVACLEEIALNNSWITSEVAIKHYVNKPNNQYGKYILNIVNRNYSI